MALRGNGTIEGGRGGNHAASLLYVFINTKTERHTLTHTHTDREREREREEHDPERSRILFTSPQCQTAALAATYKALVINVHELEEGIGVLLTRSGLLRRLLTVTIVHTLHGSLLYILRCVPSRCVEVEALRAREESNRDFLENELEYFILRMEETMEAEWNADRACNA